MFTDVESARLLSWWVTAQGGGHCRTGMKFCKSFLSRHSAASLPLRKWWSSPASTSPALTETPVLQPRKNVHSAGCCVVLLRWAGRAPTLGDVSAVQRTFLDCFGNGCAKLSDDGAGVVAADHSAARHDHVGSSLRKIHTRSVSKQNHTNLTEGFLLDLIPWPLHICGWCQGRRLRPLQCLARGTDSSTSSPGRHRRRKGESISGRAGRGSVAY